VSSRQHFTGVTDAYIVTWRSHLGQKGAAGRALLDAAEQWAVANGHERLTLESGAANHRARKFYDRDGYYTENVGLTKLLS
jgi:GNAT superfamily N-acetyltransferase